VQVRCAVVALWSERHQRYAAKTGPETSNLTQNYGFAGSSFLAAGRQPSPLDATDHTTGPSRPIDPTAPRPTPNAEVASTDLPSSKTTVVSPPAGVDGADESSAGEWQSLLENAVSDQERALGADQGHDPSTA